MNCALSLNNKNKNYHETRDDSQNFESSQQFKAQLALLDRETAARVQKENKNLGNHIFEKASVILIKNPNNIISFDRLMTMCNVTLQFSRQNFILEGSKKSK